MGHPKKECSMILPKAIGVPRPHAFSLVAISLLNLIGGWRMETVEQFEVRNQHLCTVPAMNCRWLQNAWNADRLKVSATIADNCTKGGWCTFMLKEVVRQQKNKEPVQQQPTTVCQKQ